MIITRDNLQNALIIAITDYSIDDNHIEHDEIANIIDEFRRLAGKLMTVSEDRTDEDEE